MLMAPLHTCLVTKLCLWGKLVWQCVTNGNSRGARRPFWSPLLTGPLFMGNSAKSTSAVIDDPLVKGIKWGRYMSAAENLLPTLLHKESPLAFIH